MSWILSMLLTVAPMAHAVEVSVAEVGHAYNPSWSPKGDYLAFELNEREGEITVYVVKVQNGVPLGQPRRLDVAGGREGAFGSSSSIAVGPVWHPQGMLLFEGSNAGGTNRIFFWQPGGQKASELFPSSQIGGDLSWPTVSSDGARIAFVSDATGNGDLYFWNQSNGKIEQRVSTTASEMAPRFSGDGTQVAFSRKSRGGQDLFVLEGDKSSARQGGNGDQTRPIWNGSEVVYFTNERGTDQWDIAVSHSQNKRSVLAQDVRLAHRSAPALSPDGRWVAYGVMDPDKANQIMLTTLDGSKTVGVDTGMVAVGEPNLTSVNGRIYLSFTGIPADESEWRQVHIIDITTSLD